MIDKNKIAKAARQISEKVVDAKGFDDSKPTHLAFLDGHIDGFNAGAKWAINEFIKDLWHAIDENPKKYYKCLVEVVYHRPLNMTDEIDYVTSHLTNFGWDESSFKRSDYAIKRWIYIDDLLKECNHD